MDEICSLIHGCLQTLAVDIGPRPAASRGQERAREYIAGVLTEAGWDVEVQQADCPRWELGALSLRVDGRELGALANPHTPSCHLSAPVVQVSTLDQLKEAQLTDRIVVLSGELTAAQFFPRNFDFFRDEKQDETINTVEQKAPLAVITVTSRPVPEPLIVDSDFVLPSITVSAQVGAELKTGRTVDLNIEATSQPGSVSNIIARRPGTGGRRLVACAHYDTAVYTPGAVDNAGGVAALLALARLLPSGSRTGFELVAFGGEDSWYPGEVDYQRRNESYYPEITAAINIDGIGIRGYGDTVALLACPEALSEAVTGLLPDHPGITTTDPWYESDHSLFWPKGIPSLALTSAHGVGWGPLHTAEDTPELVDEDRIAATVKFIADIVRVMQ